MPVQHPNTLWIQSDGTDFIVCVEDGDDGGKTLLILRACYAEQEVVGGCDQSFLFMREDDKWFAVAEQACL